MSTQTAIPQDHVPAIPNGSAAAAILSAGIGSFALAIFSVATDKSTSLKSLAAFYRPLAPSPA